MDFSKEEYRVLLKKDFVAFIEHSFNELNPQTSFVPAPYLELIASKLEACRRGEIKRLAICIPPRFLKSHSASIAFVAWILGHDPSKQIICASYGQDLAEKLARDTKKVMMSSWYRDVFPTRLSPQRQATSDFMTTRQGTRMATSVGGVLTGRGADFIILDDVLKPDDALSETKRKAANEWFDNTVQSRLNNKREGCIIIIMQRLHQDDLVGHVLNQEHWDVVNLPAIAFQNEHHIIKSVYGTKFFDRDVGESLDPQRYPASVFEEERKKIGEYNFQSQYQQNPTPVGGMIIKPEWFKTYDQNDPPKFDYIVQSWDTASKSSELSDYSVCTTWGKKSNHYYLIHVFRRRLDYPDLKREVMGQARYYKASIVIIEDKASGIQLIQDLKRDGLGGLKAYDPKGNDKIMRVHALTSIIENGQVWLPKEAYWLKDYIFELTSFPGSKYDDQVDSTTQALDWMHNKKRGIFD